RWHVVLSGPCHPERSKGSHAGTPPRRRSFAALRVTRKHAITRTTIPVQWHVPPPIADAVAAARAACGGLETGHGCAWQRLGSFLSGDLATGGPTLLLRVDPV